MMVVIRPHMKKINYHLPHRSRVKKPSVLFYRHKNEQNICDDLLQTGSETHTVTI